MSNDNMKYWSQVNQPPADALKTIKGGRLSGMTDINPQWRYQVMTETFGPIGFGWKYDIIKTWIEPGPDGQVSQFAQINLYIKGSQEWSAPIPGIGGSAFVAKERGGLYMSDEAIKMAVTDALGVAMKMLGVAADIYAGKWDGSKYTSPAAPQGGNGRKKFDPTSANGADEPPKHRLARALHERIGKDDTEAIHYYMAIDAGRAQAGKPKLTDGEKPTDEDMVDAAKWVESLPEDANFDEAVSAQISEVTA